jgi:high affinity Mn2+ porin
MKPRALAPLASLFCFVGLVGLAGNALADDPVTPATLLDHPQDSALFVGGQANAIYQYHPDFPAKYSGKSSLQPRHEGITSYVISLFVGYALGPTTELFFDGEMAAGGGLSTALGLGGFTNLDVVRNPTLGSDPYPARFFIRQIIPLSHTYVDATRGHLAMATRLPETRIELRAGKLSTADLFDVNSVGSDSHTQFMNWTADNNGAYDYAADTRGYTYGAVASLESPSVSLRVGFMLMPTVANGITLDWHLDRSRGDNVELELHRRLLTGRLSTLRLLGFANHAAMGSYQEAITAFEQGREPVPDIEAHRRPGRVKYGIGLNVEQEIVGPLRGFARAGWSEGAYESFAYTEVNDTIAVGADLRGTLWKRASDKVGLAVISNGLSADHRRYLALGGHGFLLGDGALTYGRENIVESYYNLMIHRGISAAMDVQIVENPGYNHDRGPVVVLSGRAHIEI